MSRLANAIGAASLALLLCGVAAAQSDQERHERWRGMSPEHKQELQKR